MVKLKSIIRHLIKFVKPKANQGLSLFELPQPLQLSLWCFMRNFVPIPLDLSELAW